MSLIIPRRLSEAVENGISAYERNQDAHSRKECINLIRAHVEDFVTQHLCELVKVCDDPTRFANQINIFREALKEK